MSKQQAVEFQALSEKMGHSLPSKALQKIFRKNWNFELEDWTNLNDDIINAAEDEIKRRVLSSMIPHDADERAAFYADLTRLINAAWCRSWRNMKHEKTRKLKRRGKAKESDGETTGGEASDKPATKKTAINQTTGSETIGSETIGSENIGSETTGVQQSGTEKGPFRPW